MMFCCISDRVWIRRLLLLIHVPQVFWQTRSYITFHICNPQVLNFDCWQATRLMDGIKHEINAISKRLRFEVFRSWFEFLSPLFGKIDTFSRYTRPTPSYKKQCSISRTQMHVVNFNSSGKWQNRLLYLKNTLSIDEGMLFVFTCLFVVFVYP